jgi:geranylgeranyl pyrophosphate synthase
MARVASTALNAVGPVQLPATYAHCLERTRQALLARLTHAPACDTLRRYFKRGKMLRAYLVFAASSAVGGDPEDVLVAAEAIELLHGASLFHDDIIDHAAERRGIASLHEALGVGPALVLGDELLLRALAALLEARERHPAARVLDAMEVLNRLARECCRGQFDELCADRWISEDAYLAIVSGKTAAPFVAAGELGVLLGGGTEADAARIRIYARQMGIAFQIDDDLLDLVGEPSALGKPVANSFAQGRPMLPLIYLQRLCPEPVRTRLCRSGEETWRRQELVALLQQYGIVERVRCVQQRHIDDAMAALEGLPDSVGKAALRALATIATERAVRVITTAQAPLRSSAAERG